MRANEFIKEEINPDILHPEFSHTQKIGDFTYKATASQGWSSAKYLKIEVFERGTNDPLDKIASITFIIRGDEKTGYLESINTWVADEFRNKGVASTVYAYARMLGNTIKPSKFQTGMGKGMWRAWRKSGAAKHLMKEAYTDPSIRDILKKKGYTKIGSGLDQTAYLAPDGSVLKIFGTSRNAKNSIELTPAQKIFKAFADYCLAHPDNEFLPQFSDWTTFRYKGMPYLQIKMERLFPFSDGGEGADGWNDILAKIAKEAEHSKTNEAKQEWLKKYIYTKRNDWVQEKAEQLIMHMGGNGFNKLWDTIYDLGQLANRIGLGNLDLHGGNFMLGSDGEIVIIDPFYAGRNPKE